MVTERLKGLENQFSELATRDLTQEEARSEAQAISTQMIAARVVAEQTEAFADRLSLLEASLPRLSLAQTLMMQALERQAAPWPGGSSAQDDPPAPLSSTGTPALQTPSGPPSADPAVGSGPEPALEHGEKVVAEADAEDPEAIWRMPRIVSLHQPK